MGRAVLLAVVVALGLAGMVYAFMANASPYVTVDQARVAGGDRLHLAGDIVPDSLRVDARAGIVRFMLVDAAGASLPVVYQGLPPANMGAATKVVAVGGCRDGEFQATRLLLKCPSKYSSEASG